MENALIKDVNKILYDLSFQDISHLFDFHMNKDYSAFTKKHTGFDFIERYKNVYENGNISKYWATNKFLFDEDVQLQIRLVYIKELFLYAKKRLESPKVDIRLFPADEEITYVLNEVDKYILSSNVDINYVEQVIDSEYIKMQLSFLTNRKQDEFSYDEIGKSKEILESVYRYITNNKSTNVDMIKLRKEAFTVLGISKDSIDRKLLNGLNSITDGIVEARNLYGSGHGRHPEFDFNNKELIQLTVESTIIIVKYLLMIKESRDAAET